MKRKVPMAVTKAQIIDQIQNRIGFSRKKSAEAVESMLEILKKTLENGEDVLISGFGKFEVKEKNERRGRNPATGENFPLEARRVVTFRCSPVFKDKIKK